MESENRNSFLLSENNEVIWSYLGIVISIAVTAFLLPGFMKEYAYSFVLAAMVYFPVLRGEKRGYKLEELAITLKSWKKEILFALMVMAITYPFFIFGNHFYKSIFFDRSFSFSFPETNLAYLLIEQTLFIALPEEFFYRGWMQSIFQKKFKKISFLGGDVGATIWIVSLLFALGHLAAIPSPFRLAVFFPSLLFCWMRSKRNSIISPILYHGASNALMALLNASYH